MTSLYTLKNQINVNDDITIIKLPLKDTPKKNKKKAITPSLVDNDMSLEFTPNKKHKKCENAKDDQDEKLKCNIKQTIVVPKSKGLCEIIGLEDVKSTLKEIVIFPMIYPHLFTGTINLSIF